VSREPVIDALRLRSATPDDIETVLHHRCAMFRDMRLADEAAIAAARKASEPFFLRGLKDGSYRGFLLETVDGTIVAGGGVVLLEYQPGPRDPSPRRPMVVNVYTEPAWRRRGLARRLMDAMLAWTREAGYANLFLHASDQGRGLYESLGFVPTNEMRVSLNPQSAQGTR